MATNEVTEAVARRSYGKLVKALTARTRDVADAEDALSSAFVAALVDWPENGVPRNPEGWLLTVARRRSIDAARQRRRAVEATPHLRLVAEEMEATARPSEPPVECPALRLLCTHPAIDPEIRAPLILQALLGFDAAAIASAFRVSIAAMSQRLVRAKRKLRESRSFAPEADRAELAARLDAVRHRIDAVLAEHPGTARCPG